jgi:hypothetical protein
MPYKDITKKRERDRRYYATVYREKQQEANQKWRESNPIAHAIIQRRSTLKMFYKLSLEEYDQLLAKQKGVCAVCGRPEANGKLLSVDHDHDCCSGNHSCGKCIRGLLCNKCNRGIGYFNDDLTLLKKAMVYVQEKREVQQ